MCLSTVQEKTHQGYEATMELVVGKLLGDPEMKGLTFGDFWRMSFSSASVLVFVGWNLKGLSLEEGVDFWEIETHDAFEKCNLEACEVMVNSQ